MVTGNLRLTECFSGTTATAVLAALAATGENRTLTIQVAVSSLTTYYCSIVVRCSNALSLPLTDPKLERLEAITDS